MQEWLVRGLQAGGQRRALLAVSGILLSAILAFIVAAVASSAATDNITLVDATEPVPGIEAESGGSPAPWVLRQGSAEIGLRPGRLAGFKRSGGPSSSPVPLPSIVPLLGAFSPVVAADSEVIPVVARSDCHFYSPQAPPSLIG